MRIRLGWRSRLCPWGCWPAPWVPEGAAPRGSPLVVLVWYYIGTVVVPPRGSVSLVGEGCCGRGWSQVFVLAWGGLRCLGWAGGSVFSLLFCSVSGCLPHRSAAAWVWAFPLVDHPRGASLQAWGSVSRRGRRCHCPAGWAGTGPPRREVSPQGSRTGIAFASTGSTPAFDPRHLLGGSPDSTDRAAISGSTVRRWRRLRYLPVPPRCRRQSGTRVEFT